MDNAVKRHLTSKDTWLRGFFMILFCIMQYFVKLMVLFIALFQFVAMLLTGRVNQALLKFGSELSAYAYHIYYFLTFNTNEKPYPFSDWPSVSPTAFPMPKPKSISKPKANKSKANADVKADNKPETDSAD